MSGILGWVTAGDRPLEEALAGRLLGEMAFRGAEVQEIRASAGGGVAVARDRWECGEGFAGATLVADLEGVRTVCDATLHYRSDLVASLRRAGVHPRSRSAADLITAAYRAFGTDCVQHLEGDYAFCLLDETHGRLVCARSPFGLRGLFHTRRGGATMAASTPRPLVRWLGPRTALDRVGILRSILTWTGDGTHTDWEGVFELPAGHILVAEGNSHRVSRFWRPQPSSSWASVAGPEAREALRTLLDGAAGERVTPGCSGLALSGGMDSTSILASAMEAHPAETPNLLSWKFPEGDPGDESWYVEAVAERFGLTVEWVDRESIPFHEDEERRAERRSTSRGHIFEPLNRALAGRAVGLGSRAILLGVGGDELFGLPDWPMPDLLRSGRLLRLHRYARARGYRGLRSFVDSALRPALPFFVFDGLEWLLRRRICSRIHERPIPPWIIAPEDMIEAIGASDRREFRDQWVKRYGSVTARNRAWMIGDPSYSQNARSLFDYYRDAGLELRLPFYDSRLVGFALSRTPEELNQPGRWKVILADAFQSRLPDRDRAFDAGGRKPGTLVGLMEGRWRVETDEFVSRLSRRTWVTEELGLVDPRRYGEALRERHLGLRRTFISDFTQTTLAEVWIRAHAGSEVSRSHNASL